MQNNLLHLLEGCGKRVGKFGGAGLGAAAPRADGNHYSVVQNVVEAAVAVEAHWRHDAAVRNVAQQTGRQVKIPGTTTEILIFFFNLRICI